MNYEETNEVWEEELENNRDTSMYDKSFTTDEFTELVNEKPLTNYNINQQIFLDCLDKLQVGTFHKGKFKAFGRNFKTYFVDVYGFDVQCQLSKKELIKWQIYDDNWDIRKKNIEDYESSIVGREFTVLITSNKNFKVDAVSIDNLLKISWTQNNFGLHVFVNGARIIDYNEKYLSAFEKAKIYDFIKSLNVDKSTKVIYYHHALAAKNLILVPFDEVIISPKLLPSMYYEFDSYAPREYVDANNPNLIVDEISGNVKSMKYTQMPFYLYSSQVKLLNNINSLK